MARLFSSAFRSSWLRLPLLCLWLCGLSACGTIITKIDTEAPSACTGRKINPVYSGTRLSLGCARTSEVYYVFVIDVPLSFTADTGVLPISLFQLAYRYGENYFFPPEREEGVVLRPEATVGPQ